MEKKNEAKDAVSNLLFCDGCFRNCFAAVFRTLDWVTMRVLNFEVLMHTNGQFEAKKHVYLRVLLHASIFCESSQSCKRYQLQI